MSDWFEAEPPLRVVLAAELRRLKRRAQVRWPLVLAIGAVLTALVVWKAASKPAMYRARIVLAITEGELVSGRDATPLHEVRDYIGTTLLTNAELLALIDREKLFRRQRRTFGDAFAIASFRDMIGIGVWRNYFQYSYSYDERRTARVAIVFTHADHKFAYKMAREVALAVMRREAERRVNASEELLAQSRAVRASARARLAESQAEQNAAATALAAAELRGDPGQIAVESVRASDATMHLMRAQEAFGAVEQQTTAEALHAAVTAAGLALDIAIVDDRKPERAERSPLVLIALALVALCIFLPLAGVVIGAFDTRVHDLEDVGRLGLAPLGHLPGFPGDRVGGLRDRGVPRQAMPSWVPWR